MLLFRDKVILAVDVTDLMSALSIARDFRGCTLTVKLGPSLYGAHGSMGARSFRELGIRDLLLDLRLCGRPWEINTTVIEVAKLTGMSGITVQACCGARGVKAAVEASRAVALFMGVKQGPKILVSMIPSHLSDPELKDELKLSCGRFEYVEHVARWAQREGASGLVVDYTDLAGLKKKRCSLPLVAAAKRGFAGRLADIPVSQRALPGVRGVLQAGASHVLFDAALIQGQDQEWAADMLARDIL